MRLIDADALMELARNHVNRTVDCNDIARFPTIDAVPVVHANWKRHDEDWRHQYAGNECSACGFVLYGPVGHYCPRCGAKMDGGDDGAT